MRRATHMILFAAILTLFTGLMAAPSAFADEADAYFFNRRKAPATEYSLVGPHSSLEATNTAIRWSLDNGYEVEWEADGSAPRILVEQAAPVVETPSQVVVVVPKIVYVTPTYRWRYWNSYRYYWKSWKVKYHWKGYHHWKHKHHSWKHKHNYKKHHGHKKQGNKKTYGKSKLKKKVGKWMKSKFKNKKKNKKSRRKGKK